MDAANGTSGGRFHKDSDLKEVVRFPHVAWDWLMDNPAWAVAILFDVLVAVAVVVALTWAGSRGVFMFLDNVASGRVEIARPWREYRKEGDSLFVWRLVFGLLTFVAFGGLATWFFVRSEALYDSGFDLSIPLGLVVGLAFIGLAFGLVIGYVVLFLKHFVAALMYKRRISAVAAWRMFLGLFRQYPFHFLGYGIVVFLFVFAFIATTVVVAIIACCVGWILLIPYIQTVITLPLWYTIRAFSLEFLAQFGPEYDVLPRPAAPPAPATEAPAV